jgi:AcrR family transcriptional regulator
MRAETKEKREAQIAEAAYRLLEERGYGAVSMLMIAKAAKASNETLYKWYGDKAGLFLALVQRNTREVQVVLDGLSPQADLREALSQVGPVLLAMLLGPRAVALNRAAAGDASGRLGQALAEAGRNVVGPMLARMMARAEIALPPREAAQLYIALLVGDSQIRRVIGVMAEPDQAEIRERADRALDHFAILAGL